MASGSSLWLRLPWLLLLFDGVVYGQLAFTTTVGPQTDSYQEPRKRCLGPSGYCSAPIRGNAQCINGYCECDSPYYSRVSCLPTVGPCNVRKNGPIILHATPSSTRSYDTDVFTCIGNRGGRADVHVLGVYEGKFNTRPPTPAPMDVVITPTSPIRPMILVLTNYEPVNWRLNHPLSLNIEKVILIAYYIDLSSVTSTKGVRLNVEKRGRGAARGLGDDSGGGDTVGMLRDLIQDYGTVTSLAGTYRAYHWDWTLPPGKEGTPGIQSTASSTSLVPSSTDSYQEPRISCRNGNCYGLVPSRVDSQCVNGYCECQSPSYGRLSCLPSVGSCQIRQDDPDNVHATPRYAGSLTGNSVYSCIGDQGSVADVHVLGVYEADTGTGPGEVHVVITSSSPARPVILVLTSYDPVHWILDHPASLTIKKAILISLYPDHSYVISDSQAHFDVEREGGSYGYGSDIGGGRTAAILQQLTRDYGAVTSFAGTYRADSLDWNLPLGNEMIEGPRVLLTPRTTEGYGNEFSDESSAGLVIPVVVATSIVLLGCTCAFGYCCVYASSKRRDTRQRAAETRRRAAGVRPAREAFVHSGPPVHAPLSSTSVTSVSYEMDKLPSYAEVVADPHLYPPAGGYPPEYSYPQQPNSQQQHFSSSTSSFATTTPPITTS